MRHAGPLACLGGAASEQAGGCAPAWFAVRAEALRFGVDTVAGENVAVGAPAPQHHGARIAVGDQCVEIAPLCREDGELLVKHRLGDRVF